MAEYLAADVVLSKPYMTHLRKIIFGVSLFLQPDQDAETENADLRLYQRQSALI